VRFFTGGAQSVRGFSYQSLSPKDSQGAIIGGSHLVVGSIEFEHSFSDKWGAATFYDVGNALDNFSDKLERGAGLGMRWRSPVGPIRIDLASAISRDNKPWRLHISIGPDL
jgi:translocation and assembly module TamA